MEAVPTADNSADLLTKSLPRDAYERHRKRLLNLSEPVSNAKVERSWSAMISEIRAQI